MIDVSTVDGSNWTVRVANAVGVIGLPGVRLIVEPKIPRHHLVYLLGMGATAPRSAGSVVEYEESESFWELLAKMFVDSAERLVAHGLRRSYRHHREELSFIRGRINPTSSHLRLRRGLMRFDCEFDTYDLDMPLNRTILAAARRVVRSDSVDPEVRRRAGGVVSAFYGVSNFEEADLKVVPDRDTAAYLEVHACARFILAGRGLGFGGNGIGGETYLIPTPLAVESAIRRLVTNALATQVTVSRGRKVVSGTSLTLNPDLVVGLDAIGDVKYKVWSGVWVRSDLYQLIAFATGYSATHALHLGFSVEPSRGGFWVGGVCVSRVVWNACPDISAEAACDSFVRDLRHWWVTAAPTCYAVSDAAITD